MVEMASLPHWTSFTFPLWTATYNYIQNRTSKSFCCCICLLPDIQQNKTMIECGEGRERQDKTEQAWGKRQTCCLSRIMSGLSQSHPTRDMTTSRLLCTTQNHDTRQVVLHLYFVDYTAHQPIILTFHSVTTIRKRKVGRQGISEVVSLKVTTLKCVSEEK